MKSTLFRGEGEVYLMELPPYRMPTLKSLMLHMWDRGRMYVQKAGTIILATSIILYICNTWPEKTDFSKDYDTEIEQIQKSKALTDAQIRILEDAGLLEEEAISEAKKSGVLSDEQIGALREKELSDVQKIIVSAAEERNNAVTMLENEKKAEQMEYTISGRVGMRLNRSSVPSDSTGS